MLTGCNSPSITEPADSCVTSQKFQTARCGKRILDYKQERKIVGEWQDITTLKDKPLEEAGDMVCFSLESWLVKIKPKLKEGHDFWSDSNTKNKNVKNLTDDQDKIIEVSNELNNETI